MPYKTWGCSICGMQAPKRLRAHGKFKERMDWLRNHYREYHPDEYKKMIQKIKKARRK